VSRTTPKVVGVPPCSSEAESLGEGDLLGREVPPGARDAGRGRLAPRGASEGPEGLGAGHELVEPAGQPRVPGQRRVAERADLLDQAAGQVAALLPLVQVEALGEAAAVELVEVDVVTGRAQRGAEHVAHALAAQGGQAALAAQVAGDAVVDLLGGQVRELWIVKQPLGHGADVHLGRPAVDHVVAGDVEQVGVANAAAVAVAQGGVQHLVGQDEPPFLVVELPQRVDVDLACLGVDGGDRDAVRAGELRVGDQLDAGRDAAELGVPPARTKLRAWGGRRR
jgi:hypothetical protein